jgi:3-methyl-2-oxobutanoate hydroxymethyltransferase
MRAIKNFARVSKLVTLSVNHAQCNVNLFQQTRRYSVQSFSDKVTVNTIHKNYTSSVPITMMTATDYHSGSMVDAAGIDIVLVGDSLAMTALGYTDTTQITMEEIIHHAKAVARGVRNGFLLVDMPFGSYEESVQHAVHNAFRLVKEAGANGVKLEGGKKVANQIKAIVESGIPVVGHIGLTPQSINALGGYHTVGKTSQEALKLLEDAKALEEAGCVGIVLECIPERIAEKITAHVHIPTIGIGSGLGVNGQVLVYHDVLGMYDKFTPKFCKQYAKLNEQISEALKSYKDEVVNRSFPSQEYSFRIKKDQLQEFLQQMPKEESNESDQKESSMEVDKLKLLAVAQAHMQTTIPSVKM